MVKNQPANVGATGDGGSSPGLGNPLEKELATHSSILTWESPWTEEPWGLQAVGPQSQLHLPLLLTPTRNFTESPALFSL